MRKRWAKIITLLTAVLVILLSIIFAIQQNTPQSIAPSLTKTQDRYAPAEVLSKPDMQRAALLAAGRRVFETKGCMRCHSIAGKGNPRIALDGVGDRLTAKAIRQWILAADELKAQLSTRTILTKQTYRDLADEEMAALVIYLQGLPSVTNGKM